MQANKIRSWWIAFMSIMTTIRYSLQVQVLMLLAPAKKARQIFDKQFRTWARKILRYPRIHTKVIGKENLQFTENRPYIIMSNHISNYDIPLIIEAIPGSVRMLAKKELFRLPLLYRTLRVGEFASIDRQNREQALKDLEYAKKLMKSGIRLWISPEGTRSRDNTMNPFKKGGFMIALQTGATIIPVGIRGSYEILPPKTVKFLLHQTAEVHIGKPIDASEYSMEQRDQLLKTVENTVRELAGEATTEQAP